MNTPLLFSKSGLFSKTGLIVLAVVCAIAIGVINLAWNGVRIDLTENKLYTLSQGSRNILDGLEQPVTLRFYFSARQTESSPALRNYARRIQELLEEYAQFGGSNIDLRVIDPEPFSEEEDAADAYGLQKVRLSVGGDQLLMGLVGEREGGQPERIAFFHPDREEFLEQDISKLIFSASRGRKPTLGIMSSLNVNGGVDLNTRQPTPAWAAITQLRRLYNVLNISTLDKSIADNVDLLLLIQPGTLPESALYAIDQYVMRGGNAIIFTDPMSDMALLQGGAPAVPEAAASITRLLEHWGVKVVRDKILGDARYALSVSRGANQTPIRYLAIQGYGRANFPQDDVITNKLETINVGSTGVIDALADSDITFTPLITSSNQSMPIERSKFEPAPDPARLLQGFTPTGKKYTIAARVTGDFKTAFPEGYTPPEPEKSEEDQANSEADSEAKAAQEAAQLPEHIDATAQPGNLIVVADSDILSNRLWVRVQDFFGQQITSPFADNGDFLLNAVDNLLGNADLISIRGRSRYSRPFEVVDELRRDADARFQNKERELLVRLQEAERKIAELQQKKQGEEGALTLSEEQAETVKGFQQEKLKVRKELREVRHQLGSDIDNLGSWLKFINIALIPILLTLGILLFKVGRRIRLVRT